MVLWCDSLAVTGANQVSHQSGEVLCVPFYAAYYSSRANICTRCHIYRRISCFVETERGLLFAFTTLTVLPLHSDLCVAESGGLIWHEFRGIPSAASDRGGNGIGCLLFDGHSRLGGACDVSRICNDKDRAHIIPQFK